MQFLLIFLALYAELMHEVVGDNCRLGNGHEGQSWMKEVRFQVVSRGFRVTQPVDILYTLEHPYHQRLLHTPPAPDNLVLAYRFTNLQRAPHEQQ
jgi:hypothetical protein